MARARQPDDSVTFSISRDFMVAYNDTFSRNPDHPEADISYTHETIYTPKEIKAIQTELTQFLDATALSNPIDAVKQKDKDQLVKDIFRRQFFTFDEKGQTKQSGAYLLSVLFDKKMEADGVKIDEDKLREFKSHLTKEEAQVILMAKNYVQSVVVQGGPLDLMDMGLLAANVFLKINISTSTPDFAYLISKNPANGNIILEYKSNFILTDIVDQEGYSDSAVYHNKYVLKKSIDQKTHESTYALVHDKSEFKLAPLLWNRLIENAKKAILLDPTLDDIANETMRKFASVVPFLVNKEFRAYYFKQLDALPNKKMAADLMQFIKIAAPEALLHFEIEKLNDAKGDAEFKNNVGLVAKKLDELKSRPGVTRKHLIKAVEFMREATQIDSESVSDKLKQLPNYLDNILQEIDLNYIDHLKTEASPRVQAEYKKFIQQLKQDRLASEPVPPAERAMLAKLFIDIDAFRQKYVRSLDQKMPALDVGLQHEFAAIRQQLSSIHASQLISEELMTPLTQQVAYLSYITTADPAKRHQLPYGLYNLWLEDALDRLEQGPLLTREEFIYFNKIRHEIEIWSDAHPTGQGLLTDADRYLLADVMTKLAHVERSIRKHAPFERLDMRAGQKAVHVVETQGVRPTQEDRFVAGTLPELKALNESSDEQMQQLLAATAVGLHQKLQADLNPELKKQGATLSGIVIKGSKIYNVNVGDSAAFVAIRNKDGEVIAVKALTKQLHDKANTSERERVVEQLGVTRFFGDELLAPKDKWQAGYYSEPEISVFDMKDVPVGCSVTVLNMCDGALEHPVKGRKTDEDPLLKSESYLKDILNAQLIKDKDSTDAELAASVVTRALSDDSGDNITVMAMQVPSVTSDVTPSFMLLADGHGGSAVAAFLTEQFENVLKHELYIKAQLKTEVESLLTEMKTLSSEVPKLDELVNKLKAYEKEHKMESISDYIVEKFASRSLTDDEAQTPGACNLKEKAKEFKPQIVALTALQHSMTDKINAAHALVKKIEDEISMYSKRQGKDDIAQTQALTAFVQVLNEQIKQFEKVKESVGQGMLYIKAPLVRQVVDPDAPKKKEVRTVMLLINKIKTKYNEIEGANKPSALRLFKKTSTHGDDIDQLSKRVAAVTDESQRFHLLFKEFVDNCLKIKVKPGESVERSVVTKAMDKLINDIQEKGGTPKAGHHYKRLMALSVAKLINDDKGFLAGLSKKDNTLLNIGVMANEQLQTITPVLEYGDDFNLTRRDSAAQSARRKSSGAGGGS